MEVTSATSKGQVTVPESVRQKLGIRQGRRVDIAVVSDHVEVRVKSSRSEVTESGFGMLKSYRLAVPVDFCVATLQKK